MVINTDTDVSPLSLYCLSSVISGVFWLVSSSPQRQASYSWKQPASRLLTRLTYTYIWRNYSRKNRSTLTSSSSGSSPPIEFERTPMPNTPPRPWPESLSLRMRRSARCTSDWLPLPVTETSLRVAVAAWPPSNIPGKTATAPGG